MKTRILFLILFASALSFSACNKETEGDKTANKLIGKWTMRGIPGEITVSGFDIIAYMVTNFGYTMEEAQSISDSIISEINDKNAGTITFNSNGTFRMSFTSTNEEENGTWYVSIDGTMLNLYIRNGEELLPILSISSSYAEIEIPAEQLAIDLDKDGANETTADIEMILELSK